jgi:RHS repeat-associated protein
VDSTGAYTLVFDFLNRVTSEQEPFGQRLTFTWDAAGNRVVVQDSKGGTTTSTYDALNRLTQRQFGGSGQTPLHVNLTWTARDQLSTVTRYKDQGGTSLAGTTTYQYDAAMRLTNLQHTDSAGNNIGSYVYNYDPGNRLTSETDNGTTTSYQYDADSQLTQAGTATYGYDANGNRTNTGYTTGAGNQLTNDGTWTYTYDNEGNLTKKSKGASAETWTFGYDSLNRLVSAKDAATDGGTTLTLVTYTYDVFGNLTEEDAWTQSSGTTTVSRYAYDGTNAWADLNGSNALVMRRLYLDGVDQPFARIDASGNAAWYLPDHLGSERDIENYAGTMVLDHMDYSAYGNITNETNGANGDRFKYAAGYYDPYTAQILFGRRWDLPPVGRWLQQDPLGFGAGDSNLYRYVGNAPTDAKDPSGRDVFCLVNEHARSEQTTGYGHAAVLVGNPDTGCYYYSSEQTMRFSYWPNRPFPPTHEPPLSVYTNYLYWHTSPEQDNRAVAEGDSLYHQDRLWTPWNNCVVPACAIVEAAGIPIRPTYIGRQTPPPWGWIGGAAAIGGGLCAGGMAWIWSTFPDPWGTYLLNRGIADSYGPWPPPSGLTQRPNRSHHTPYDESFIPYPLPQMRIPYDPDRPTPYDPYLPWRPDPIPYDPDRPTPYDPYLPWRPHPIPYDPDRPTPYDPYLPWRPHPNSLEPR